MLELKGETDESGHLSTARNPFRASKIREIGGIVCDTNAKSASEFIKEYWGLGIGNCNEETWQADFVIDAGGWPGALEEMIANAKAGSDIAIVALGRSPERVVETDLVNKGMSIHGAYAYTTEDCRQVISLMEKDPELFSPLHTATYPLSEIKSAFDAANDSRHQMKILIDTQK